MAGPLVRRSGTDCGAGADSRGRQRVWPSAARSALGLRRPERPFSRGNSGLRAFGRHVRIVADPLTTNTGRVFLGPRGGEHVDLRQRRSMRPHDPIEIGLLCPSGLVLFCVRRSPHRVLVRCPDGR